MIMTVESELKRIADAMEAFLALETGQPVVKFVRQAELPLNETPVEGKKKPGRPAKPAKEAKEPDADTDSEAESSITKEQVRAALQGLKNREQGLEILSKFDTQTLSALKESDYAAVMELAKKAADDE